MSEADSSEKNGDSLYEEIPDGSDQRLYCCEIVKSGLLFLLRRDAADNTDTYVCRISSHKREDHQ